MGLDIRYARSGGLSIAHQVVGDGETDLLYVPGWVSNLVYGWEIPHFRAFYERLAESFRLILFDKRGTGLSDLGGHFPALETRMDDVRAVLDAVGSSRAVLLAAQDGCSMAALYAATYPERTQALVLFHPVAHNPGAQGEEVRAELAELRDSWGTQEYCDKLLTDGAPSLAQDPEQRTLLANWLRVGASPAVAYALNRAFYETDLREVLPAVRVPTLVLYRPGYFEPHSLDVAGRIEGAQGTPDLRKRDVLHANVSGGCGGGRAVRGWRGSTEGSRQRPRHRALHRHRRVDGTGGRARRPHLA